MSHRSACIYMHADAPKNALICRNEGTTRRQREPEQGVLCAAPSPAVAAVDRDRVGARCVLSVRDISGVVTRRCGVPESAGVGPGLPVGVSGIGGRRCAGGTAAW